MADIDRRLEQLRSNFVNSMEQSAKIANELNKNIEQSRSNLQQFEYRVSMLQKASEISAQQTHRSVSTVKDAYIDTTRKLDRQLNTLNRSMVSLNQRFGQHANVIKTSVQGLGKDIQLQVRSMREFSKQFRDTLRYFGQYVGNIFASISRHAMEMGRSIGRTFGGAVRGSGNLMSRVGGALNAGGAARQFKDFMRMGLLGGPLGAEILGPVLQAAGIVGGSAARGVGRAVKWTGKKAWGATKAIGGAGLDIMGFALNKMTATLDKLFSFLVGSSNSPVKNFDNLQKNLRRSTVRISQDGTIQAYEPVKTSVSKNAKNVFITMNAAGGGKGGLDQYFKDTKKGFLPSFGGIFGSAASVVGYTIPAFGTGYRSELLSLKPHKGVLPAIFKALTYIYVHNRFASEENNGLLIQLTEVVKEGLQVDKKLKYPKARSISQWIGTKARSLIMDAIGGKIGGLGNVGAQGDASSAVLGMLFGNLGMTAGAVSSKAGQLKDGVIGSYMRYISHDLPEKVADMINNFGDKFVAAMEDKSKRGGEINSWIDRMLRIYQNLVPEVMKKTLFGDKFDVDSEGNRQNRGVIGGVINAAETAVRSLEDTVKALGSISIALTQIGKEGFWTNLKEAGRNLIDASGMFASSVGQIMQVGYNLLPAQKEMQIWFSKKVLSRNLAKGFAEIRSRIYELSMLPLNTGIAVAQYIFGGMKDENGQPIGRELKRVLQPAGELLANLQRNASEGRGYFKEAKAKGFANTIGKEVTDSVHTAKENIGVILSSHIKRAFSGGAPTPAGNAHGARFRVPGRIGETVKGMFQTASGKVHEVLMQGGEKMYASNPSSAGLAGNQEARTLFSFVTEPLMNVLSRNGVNQTVEKAIIYSGEITSRKLEKLYSLFSGKRYNERMVRISGYKPPLRQSIPVKATQHDKGARINVGNAEEMGGEGGGGGWWDTAMDLMMIKSMSGGKGGAGLPSAGGKSILSRMVGKGGLIGRGGRLAGFGASMLQKLGLHKLLGPLLGLGASGAALGGKAAIGAGGLAAGAGLKVGGMGAGAIGKSLMFGLKGLPKVLKIGGPIGAAAGFVIDLFMGKSVLRSGFNAVGSIGGAALGTLVGGPGFGTIIGGIIGYIIADLIGAGIKKLFTSKPKISGAGQRSMDAFKHAGMPTNMLKGGGSFNTRKYHSGGIVGKTIQGQKQGASEVATILKEGEAVLNKQQVQQLIQTNPEFAKSIPGMSGSYGSQLSAALAETGSPLGETIRNQGMAGYLDRKDQIEKEREAKKYRDAIKTTLEDIELNTGETALHFTNTAAASKVRMNSGSGVQFKREGTRMVRKTAPSGAAIGTTGGGKTSTPASAAGAAKGGGGATPKISSFTVGSGQFAGIGGLSAQYESNGDPGTVSTGKGDRGGVSYGTYQFASNTGSADEFVRNSPWAAEFEGMKAGTPEFSAKWKEIAAREPDKFKDFQHDYIAQKFFVPQAEKIKKETGLDVMSKSNALKDVVWSVAVQHGPGAGIVTTALAGKDVASMSESDIINAIYDERSKVEKHFKSSPSLHGSLKGRFESERQQALAMVGSGGGGAASSTPASATPPSSGTAPTTSTGSAAPAPADLATSQFTPVDGAGPAASYMAANPTSAATTPSTPATASSGGGWDVLRKTDKQVNTGGWDMLSKTDRQVGTGWDVKSSSNRQVGTGWDVLKKTDRKIGPAMSGGGGMKLEDIVGMSTTNSILANQMQTLPLMAQLGKFGESMQGFVSNSKKILSSPVISTNSTNVSNNSNVVDNSMTMDLDSQILDLIFQNV